MKKVIVMLITGLYILSGAFSDRAYSKGYVNPQLIVYSDWVATHKDDPNVILIDVRSPKDYVEGHIPGAILIPWKSVRDKKGVFVGVEKAEKILSKKGIDNTKEVVVYGNRGGAISSYLFWMFEYMGHEKVRHFDGGMEVWTAEGRRLSKKIEDLPPAIYKAKKVRKGILVKNKWVRDRLDNPNYVIVDPRRPVEFHGKKIKGDDLRGGHIRGAINIDAQDDQWQDKVLKKIKPADELIALFKAKGITKDMDKKIILFCRTTRRTSYMYFGLRLIGFKPEQLIQSDEGYIFWANNLDWPLEEETFADK